MNKLVFFDDFMLWKTAGMRRRTFAPKQLPELTFHRPGGTGGRLLYYPDAGRYRMLYDLLPDITNDWGRMPVYEESTDLIHWTEPDDLSAPDRLPSVSVMIDDHDTDPSRRYKCIYFNYKDPKNAPGHIAFSPDGVHWAKEESHPFCRHASDTYNNLFYNESLGEYQLILRPNHIDRRITCIRSKDLKEWSRPELMLTPDPFDEPFSEYYGMLVLPQEGYFLGMLWVFYTDPDDFISYKMAGKVDSFLTYSYDGLHWNKASSRPVTERPMPPEYGNACLYMHLPQPGRTETEWLFSGLGTRIDHAAGFTPAYPDSKIPEYAQTYGRSASNLYSIRKEGFVGLESVGYQAHITLKAVQIAGENLSFNLCAPCGQVRFQLSKLPGQPYEGFAFENSTPFCGDDICYSPSWQGHALSELKGQRVFIELELNSAILFTVQGDFNIHHALQPQASLGDARILSE